MATNFEKGLQSMGVPVLTGLLQYITGQAYFVDPKYGSDSNKGTTIDAPLRSVVTAYGKCRDGYGDGVVLLSRGDTSSSDVTTYLTETLVWAKDRCHLIGLAAPTGVSPRARISTSGTTAINPALQITGQGSVFANFQVYAGLDATVAANGVEVTGERNYFWRVHFAGIGNAKNDLANAYSLKLTGGGENRFDDCVIGIDTIARGSAANSELMLATATARNRFVDCEFRTNAEAAGHQFVLAGASAIEREVLFENCYFHNPAANTSITQMNEVFEVNATQNGSILLRNCTVLGADDWDDADTGIVYLDGAAPTALTSGLAVATDES